MSEIQSRQQECSKIHETYFKGNQFNLIAKNTFNYSYFIDYVSYFDTLVKATLHTFKKQ